MIRYVSNAAAGKTTWYPWLRRTKSTMSLTRAANVFRQLIKHPAALAQVTDLSRHQRTAQPADRQRERHRPAACGEPATRRSPPATTPKIRASSAKWTSMPAWALNAAFASGERRLHVELRARRRPQQAERHAGDDEADGDDKSASERRGNCGMSGVKRRPGCRPRRNTELGRRHSVMAVVSPVIRSRDVRSWEARGLVARLSDMVTAGPPGAAPTRRRAG